MAKLFRYSLDRRIINRIIIWLLKLGLSPRIYFLLTVTGLVTGKPLSVPVVVIQEGNKRWLVAPYGEVDWVKNARTSGQVRLSQQKFSEDLSIRELPLEEATPVLKKYLVEYPLTAPYFDAHANASLDEFVEDAKNKPVFELTQSMAGDNNMHLSNNA